MRCQDFVHMIGHCKQKENTNFCQQVALWSNLEKLFEVKRQCMERALRSDIQGTIHREPGTETLVL